MKTKNQDANDFVFTEPGEPVAPAQVVLPNGDVITYDQYVALTRTQGAPENSAD